MYTEIDKIQRGVNLAYHGQIHLKDNIIQACQGYAALVAGLTNLPPKTSDIINSLCSSIINYKVVHKPSSTENYFQSENDGEDDEIFFTDR